MLVDNRESARQKQKNLIIVEASGRDTTADRSGPGPAASRRHQECEDEEPRAAAAPPRRSLLPLGGATPPELFVC